MNQRIVWLWGLITVAIAGVVGAIAFHIGQGTQAVVEQAPAAGSVIYRGYGYGDRGWFFGFFPLLFFILLLVFLFRRPWGRGWYGHGSPHWHDHAHGGGTPNQPTTGTTDQKPGA